MSETAEKSDPELWEKVKDEITWESDSDDYDFNGKGGGFGGMSPPKTIQFALPPSKLMQTPGTSPPPFPFFPLVLGPEAELLKSVRTGY